MHGTARTPFSARRSVARSQPVVRAADARLAALIDPGAAARPARGRLHLGGGTRLAADGAGPSSSATSPTTAPSAGRAAAGATVERQPNDFTNGNTLDREGRVIHCEHGNRRVARTEPDGRTRGARLAPRRGQAQLTERRGGRLRRRHLVHRSALRDPRPTRRDTRRPRSSRAASSTAWTPAVGRARRRRGRPCTTRTASPSPRTSASCTWRTRTRP